MCRGYYLLATDTCARGHRYGHGRSCPWRYCLAAVVTQFDRVSVALIRIEWTLIDTMVGRSVDRVPCCYCVEPVTDDDGCMRPTSVVTSACVCDLCTSSMHQSGCLLFSIGGGGSAGTSVFTLNIWATICVLHRWLTDLHGLLRQLCLVCLFSLEVGGSLEQ